MIDYIVPENPDDRVLKRADHLLSEGKLVCFPTDTSWVICADPQIKKGVDKLYKLKGEEKSKHYALICSNISMASEVAYIDDYAFKLLKKVIPGHYTFIFEASRSIAKNIKASKTDKEVGLRFPPSPVAKKLIEYIGRPLISSNIDREKLGVEAEDEIYSYLIEDNLGHQIDLILDPGEFEFVGQSSIIDLKDEAPVIIREGAGDLSLFR